MICWLICSERAGIQEMISIAGCRNRPLCVWVAPNLRGSGCTFPDTVPPAGQREGALPLTVQIDGKALAMVRIEPGTERFDFDFALPADLVGKDAVEVTVEVGRTFIPPGEDRELGLAFGVFEIR